MAFHTILKSSKDYYEALRWARLLTDRLQQTINKNLTEDQVIYNLKSQSKRSGIWNPTIQNPETRIYANPGSRVYTRGCYEVFYAYRTLPNHHS